MWVLNLFGGLKAKLYAAGIVLGSALLAGVYWLGRRDSAAARERDDLEQQVKTIREAQEVDNDVEALDNDGLRERAAKWVREAE